MKTKVFKSIGLCLFALVSMSGQISGQDRTVLPIKEPERPVYKELDVRNTKPPKRFEVKAPKGAPNVVIVLIDDMGFGVSEAFSGSIPVPSHMKCLCE